MLGKEKCRILKQIRQRIADENDIPYVTRECGFHGECKGTCPRCESELRYLEKQLALRASLGKRVAVAALCAGLSFGAAACTPFDGARSVRSGRAPSGGGDDLQGMISYEPADTPEPDIEIETGEVAWPEETEEPCDIDLPPEPTEPGEETVELMGDVAWIPEGTDG